MNLLCPDLKALSLCHGRHSMLRCIEQNPSLAFQFHCVTCSDAANVAIASKGHVEYALQVRYRDLAVDVSNIKAAVIARNQTGGSRRG